MELATLVWILDDVGCSLFHTRALAERHESICFPPPAMGK